ncbi:hypothetical protein LTR93_011772 [Exophiala xenobiotica]|nr:hypothetical protein LTR93_011772 [Exophiala xenobiotica]
MASLADLLKDAVEISHQSLTSGLLPGESPRYHDGDGKHYVSDMVGQKIYRIDVKTGEKETVLKVEPQLNGMCFHPDGSLVYSSMFDAKLYKFDMETGQITLYADLSEFITDYCGDMVIDKHGQPDGTVQVAVEDLRFPNGVAIESSKKTLYLSESFGHFLPTFEIDAEGRLHNQATAWNMTQLTSAPRVNAIDGLLVDHRVYVRRDKRGVFTHYIQADGEPVACALSGDDGKTPFVVTNTWDKGSIFEAMMNKGTRGTITTARVEVGKGKGLP